MEITDGDDGDWEFTVADYLQLEEETELKHEFVDGAIRAMGGGSKEHARMAMTLGRQLGNQLAGRPCGIYSAAGRVRIGGFITYPDLSIACGDTDEAADADWTVMPCVLVEITSKSSWRYDRGKKRLRYFQIPSLREYVIVSHKEPAVDVYTRAADGAWTQPVTYRAGSKALLPSLAIHIDVDDLYTDPRKRQSAS